MARNVEDLAFAAGAMSRLIQGSRRECGGETLIPLEWKDVELPKRLKIGYWMEDGAVKVRDGDIRVEKRRAG
jgi:hypothetical protein